MWIHPCSHCNGSCSSLGCNGGAQHAPYLILALLKRLSRIYKAKRHRRFELQHCCQAALVQPVPPLSLGSTQVCLTNLLLSCCMPADAWRCCCCSRIPPKGQCCARLLPVDGDGSVDMQYNNSEARDLKSRIKLL